MNARITLLNVDDSEVARYTKTRTLRHAGFNVVEADTGIEALRQMEALEPSLALLDVRLPDINGIELCRRIKARWPSTMVLQTSATYVGASDRVRGLEGGADSYLIQPIDRDELVAAVRALLRLHAAEEATRALNETLETRIKERTQELRQANEQLREEIAQRQRAEAALVQSQKMQAVGQLTGAMAHDFNNLLASIVGYVHVIRFKARDPELVGLVDKALAAAERGGKLTARMLAFARTELPSNTVVDVRRLLLGMDDWLRQSLGGLIQLELHLQGDELTALTDANQLELAVLNLALNARDAMDGGGALTIEVQRITVDTSHPDLGPGAYIACVVSDTGTGMPEDVVRRAFDPFFTTKPAGKGTGLGLSQAYNLARLSGGSASIDSEPGRGTRVTLWLRAVDAADLPPQDAAAESSMGQGETILLVDDESDIRETVSQMLESHGYRVRVAADATEALAALEASLPDALLLDFAMPGRNGGEVAKAARARWPALPILFLSGHVDLEVLQAAATGLRLLRKPFGAAQLFSAVRQVLREPLRSGT